MMGSGGERDRERYHAETGSTNNCSARLAYDIDLCEP
jgi:hypothetical protein